MLRVGDVLVPRETPHGPAAARIAWAETLGNLLIVTEVHGRGSTVRVNCPTDGRSYDRGSSDILTAYERADAGGPVLWGPFLERASTEAARVDPGELGGPGSARYWEAVVRAVIGVEVEVFPEHAGRRGPVPA